jgi:hypothetical protein
LEGNLSLVHDRNQLSDFIGILSSSSTTWGINITLRDFNDTLQQQSSDKSAKNPVSSAKGKIRFV